MTQFIYFELTGNDADKFLQGQITANTASISDTYLPTAICNLKGRVQFGLWIRRIADGFGLVLCADLADEFAKHIKKFGAFSKIALSAPQPIYPVIIDERPSFGFDDMQADVAWQLLSIAQGNYWIDKEASEKFQPQELRLHQRGGVAYDKGCYLGQEIVARLYFKASPKAYLHRVASADVEFFATQAEEHHLDVVNAISTLDGSEALVVARADVIEALVANHQLQELPLPTALQADVGR